MATPATINGKGECTNCFSSDTGSQEPNAEGVYTIGKATTYVQACNAAAARTQLDGNPVTKPLSVTGVTKGYWCPQPGDPRDPTNDVGDWQADPTFPSICLSGYYCPGYNGTTVDNTQIITCPKGKICPQGNDNPLQCPPLSVCNEGTGHYGDYSVIIVLFFMYIITYTVWRIYRYVRNVKREHRQEKAGEKLLASSDGPTLARMADTIGEQDEKNEQNSQYKTTRISLVDMAILLQEGGDSPMPRTSQPKGLAGKHTAPHEVGRNDTMKIAPKSFRISLKFENLGLQLPNGKKVMEGVCGEIKSGTVTAVMGPSGAGKTTFLATLAGRAHYGKKTGRLLINGKEGELTDYSDIVGFVPQEDIMVRSLSVRELLTHSADMLLDSSWSDAQRKQKIEEVIRVLDLYAIRHSKIGDEDKRGISGGQRKRVNIGMELVGNPTVLLLDEPTSGLDSTSSKEVCAALRLMAEMGLTVITVIHQPRYEIFQMFHNVLLLGKGGRTVYLGASQDAVGYFDHIGFQCPARCNPADFMMDVIAGELPCSSNPNFKPSDLVATWTHECDNAADDAERESNMTEEDRDAFAAGATAPAGVVGPKRMVTMVTAGPDNHHDKKEEYKPRKILSFVGQVLLWSKRGDLQTLRRLKVIGIEAGMYILAATYLGLLYYYQDPYVGPGTLSQCLQQQPCKPRAMLDTLLNMSSITVLALSLISLVIRYSMHPLIHSSHTLLSYTPLISLVISIPEFGAEKIQFERERLKGAHIGAYMLGKDIARLKLTLVYSMLFILPFYSIVGSLIRNPSLPSLYAIVLLIVWTVNGIAYFVSVLAPMAYSQLCGILYVFVCFGLAGASPTLRQFYEMPIFLFQYAPRISYARYANEGFYLPLIHQWKYIMWESNNLSLESSLDSIYAYNLDGFQMCCISLLINGVVYRVLAYFVLWDNGAFATKVSKWREALDNEVRSRSATRRGKQSSNLNAKEMKPLSKKDRLGSFDASAVENPATSTEGQAEGNETLGEVRNFSTTEM
jgi:ABC-type multidrug transport system ATPase subunit